MQVWEAPINPISHLETHYSRWIQERQVCNSRIQCNQPKILRYQQMHKIQPAKGWILIYLSIKVWCRKIRILRSIVAQLPLNSHRVHQVPISDSNRQLLEETRSFKICQAYREKLIATTCIQCRKILMKTNQEIGCKAAMNYELVQTIYKHRKLICKHT